MSGEIFVALFAANYLLAGDVVTLRSCCFPAALIRIHLLLYQPIIALLSLIDQAANTNTAASLCFGVIDQHTDTRAVCFSVTTLTPVCYSHQC